MSIEINSEKFYSREELMKILKIGATTFYRYRREGLKAHKVGMEVYSQGKEVIEFIMAREGG